MRLAYALGLLLLVLLPGAGGAQTQQPPSGPTLQQMHQQLQTIMPTSYLVADCLPSVPTLAVTLAPLACQGVVATAAGSVPVSQAAASVGPLTGGDGTFWLALHVDTTTVVPGWTRQSGTHYLWQQAASPPAVTQGALLAKITVASSVISAIDDWRVPASYVRYGIYDVTDPLYGGVADATTDIGPALRQATSAAMAQGKRRVEIPAGQYALRSSVILSHGVDIRGAGWEAGVPQNSRGTWLHIDTTTFVPFVIQATGTSISHIGFDHVQPSPGPGWAPSPYPEVIAVLPNLGVPVSDITLDTLFFYRATRGIYAGPGPNNMNIGRVNIRNVYGQFFNMAIETDWNMDISRITDVHAWPYWSTDPAVLAWQRAHLYAFIIGRCDGCWVYNFFAYASRVGIYFRDSPHGPAFGFQGVNVGFDGAWIAVLNDQETGGQGMFVNLTGNGHLDGGGALVPGYENGYGIFFTGGGHRYTFVNTTLTWFALNCLTVTNSTPTGSDIALTNFTCLGDNMAALNQPSLQALNSSVLGVSGRLVFSPAFPATPYAGNFATGENPNGVFFDRDHKFFANVIGGNATLAFADGAVIQWVPAENAFVLSGPAGSYNTGGVRKYLCVQDGALTVGTSCP